MGSYGQYCPISRSADLLGDRWTILIVRDLLTGTTRFNELIRGNPGLSRALLTRRLRQLQSVGIVEQCADGTYVLTAMGQDLLPLVVDLAIWGARWTFGDPNEDELDPDLLLWWLHRRIDTDRVPGDRFTVFVRFTDHPKRYWIVIEEESSLCLADPGFDVDVSIESDRRALYRTYLGHLTLAQAQRSGEIELRGAPTAVRSFLDAFQQSPISEIIAAEGDDRRSSADAQTPKVSSSPVT